LSELYRYHLHFLPRRPFVHYRAGADKNGVATGLADDRLMSSMNLTPMSTLLNSVKDFCFDTSLTGVTAEISGQRGTHRKPPEYVDEITRDNMEMFVKLGYA
jgi:hypothetical protein